MKVVINKCYGGFGLSKEACELYAERKGIKLGEWNEAWRFHEGDFNEREIERNDPVLVQIVEELGDKANDECAKLRIVEIPDDVEWSVHEYDGIEWIAESHRTWS